MAILTDSDLALYRRLVATGRLQFPGSEETGQRSFRDLLRMTRGGDLVERVVAAGAVPGVHIAPTATGHTPDLTDPEVGARYAELGLPCIVSSQVLYPRRELADGHAARAVWAPLNSTPNDSDVGDEIVPAWASGTDYKIGDRVESNNFFYLCVQDHTSTDDDATGDPDDENTGFTAYWDDTGTAGPLSADSQFRGVTSHDGSVFTNPRTGEWFYAIFQGIAYAQRFRVSGGTVTWASFGTPPGVGNMLGVFANYDDVLHDVAFFSESQRTSAVIDGRLNYLTHYVAPDPGHETFHWRSRASQAGAPYLLGSLAASAGGADGRNNDRWYVGLDGGYDTLIELGAAWLYIEAHLTEARNSDTILQKIPIGMVRVGALTELPALTAAETDNSGDDSDKSVGLRPHTMSADGWSDAATTIWIGRRADGDIMIAGSNQELVSQRVDFFAIR